MTQSSGQTAAKALRERTCVSCGAKASKSSLLRIVRWKDGRVLFDETGRAAGRGAYVCGPDCFERSRSGKLARALKTSVRDEDCELIAVQLRALAAPKE